MEKRILENINIESYQRLLSPREVKAKLPLTDIAGETVLRGRRQLQAILTRKDTRKCLIVGPCSIHDLGAAREYATRLKALADRVNESLFVVMRVYFEKPRTVTGWKGLINDPHLDDSFCIDQGLLMARSFLLELGEMGLPAGTEALDPITPQYLADLISWTAIGARTTESQTHRELASGLSTPVGFKNGTDGSIDVAINALHAAAERHHFLGIDPEGHCATFQTKGNKHGHIVLRGGSKPNYDKESVALVEQKLRAAGLPENILIDCSHGNSLKDPMRQPTVLREGLQQILSGSQSIIGFMLESNLHPGNQTIPADLSSLQYGVSITDACLGWEMTEELILEADKQLRCLTHC